VIWQHHRNSQLRAERKDPSILRVGDQIYVPTKRPGRKLIQTDREHVFRVKALEAWVRIELTDEEGEPFARRKYALVAGGTRYEGRTTDEGMVERAVRPDAKEGELTLWPEDSQPDKTLTWKLALGHMAPSHTLAGQRQRLGNLGFSCGREEGDAAMGDETRSAVHAFQAWLGLPPTGELDPETVGRLVDAHRQT
jgi:hypothetical protein